jgi:AcrR family transcriptional regulator
MPRLIPTESRTEAVVAAVNHVLAQDGAASLSLRAIARESGVSASSLLHHYGSREHLIRIAGHWTGRARVQAIDRNSISHGPLAFLPGDAEDVVDARAWLAWLELWRSDDTLLEVVGNARLDERALLAESLDYRAGPEGLDALTAMIDGLLTAVCSPVRPMRLERAREILASALNVHVDRDAVPISAAEGPSFDAIRNRTRRWRERAAR